LFSVRQCYNPGIRFTISAQSLPIVFGNASYWNLWNDKPESEFTANLNGDTLFTDNQSQNAAQWLWDFGDGNSSTGFEPVHIYQATGNYQVILRACNNCQCDSSFRDVSVLVSATGDHNHFQRIILRQAGAPGVLETLNYQGNGRLVLYDLLGKKILETEIVSGLSANAPVPAGLYGWVLILEGGRIVRGKVFVHTL
jgi:PKD repeat protein